MKHMFRQLKITLMLLASIAGVGAVTAAPAAALPQPLTNVAACSGRTLFGFPSWDACLPKQNGQPVINQLNDVWLIAFPIVESMIRAAAYMSVGFIIFGGIKFMKSQGDPKQITAARQTITNALIGLVISILSVAIVTFVTERF